MLIVNVPAESRVLTTLGSVLDAISSPDPSGHEALIETLISRASAAVERICGRVFAREDVTETLEGSGHVELLLERTPVVSLTSVERDGGAVEDVVVSDRGAGVLFVPTGFRRDAIALPRLIEAWPSGSAKLSWEVRYIGGYYLPTFTQAASGAPGATDVLLPEDLEGLVIDAVASLFVDAVGERRQADVRSERLGDWSASYGGQSGPGGAQVSTRLPDRVRVELERNWKRTVVV